MSTTLSDHTAELARSFDESLAAILPLSELLACAREDRQLTSARQADLTGLALTGIAVPEQRGGLALDAEARVALAAIAGRRLAPAALRGESALLAPTLAALADAGDAKAEAWLQRLLAGTLRGGATALEDPGRSHALVALAPDAELVALLAGDTATVIELRDGAVKPFDALDRGQGYARVSVELDGPHLIRGDRVDRLRYDWCLTLLGEAYGAGAVALERSLAYASEREQFGKPIVAFQAVAHMLARMAVELEAAAAAIGRMIGTGDHDDLFAEVLAHRVPAAMRRVCESAIQVHGGMGFTWELGLHLHYRRVLALQAELGGPTSTAQRLGERYLASRRRHADAA